MSAMVLSAIMEVIVLLTFLGRLNASALKVMMEFNVRQVSSKPSSCNKNLSRYLKDSNLIHGCLQ